MPNRPVAIGLMLCDYVLVEERTRKVSLIGTFSGLGMERFPMAAPPFCVYALLTDGEGRMPMDLVVSHLETDQHIATYRGQVAFPDRLTDVNYLVRLRDCRFPEAGTYQFTLLADGEWVAQRRPRVYQRGDLP